MCEISINNYLLSTELGETDVVNCCIALYLLGRGKGPTRPTGSLQYRVISAMVVRMMMVVCDLTWFLGSEMTPASLQSTDSGRSPTSLLKPDPAVRSKVQTIHYSMSY